MGHDRPTVRLAGRSDPGAVGTLLSRLGLAVVAVTAPLVTGAAAGLLADARSPAVALAVALRAMEGPLVGAGGLPWLFHVATLALLCGTWLLGAGLVLEGLFD